MIVYPQRGWHIGHYALLTLALLAGVWLNRGPLVDLITLGYKDEEQSHIFLAPAVALWLLWLRRARLRYINVRPSLIGPIIVALAWVLSWWGFNNGTEVAWHGGALLSLLGILLSFTGTLPLRLFLPVFAVMAFLVPVPGSIRHGIAYPMQQFATSFTHSMLELIGVGAVQSGNVLIINGEQVAVGEACNGMRMVFSLSLIVYAFVFGTALKPGTRLVLLAMSPVIAILCNVIRLVPTSLIYGYGTPAAAQTFHWMAGWVMLVVAMLMLHGVLRTIKWLEFPVMSFRLASQ